MVDFAGGMVTALFVAGFVTGVGMAATAVTVPSTVAMALITATGVVIVVAMVIIVVAAITWPGGGSDDEAP